MLRGNNIVLDCASRRPIQILGKRVVTGNRGENASFPGIPGSRAGSGPGSPAIIGLCIMASGTHQTATSTAERVVRAAGTDESGNLEALFGSVFESLGSCLVVFDKRLNVILRNQAAKAMLPAATDAAELLALLTVEGVCVDWQGELRSIMQGPRSRHFDALAPQDGDRSETYLEIVISPLRDVETGETSGGLLMAEDVSARISMERRLAVSERMAAVGKLAARVAHELNNPLDGILRYTNMALRRAENVDDPKIGPYLECIKSGIMRMTQIVSALLEFSRSAPGGDQQATINRIVEDALSTMEGRIGESKTMVVCNLHRADMPIVRGSGIFQVLCNLIKNAIDAMPEAGTLTISTDIVGPDVVVTVADTGTGLPDDVEKIFEPFFTTKGQGKGTGLGLAVSRELIDRYGGSITAQKHEPCGTIFTVKLPVRNCSAQGVEKPSGPCPSDMGEPMRREPDGPIIASPTSKGGGPPT